MQSDGDPMADILSLSKARKAKARADKEKTAAENKVKFGLPKAAKAELKAEKLKQDNKLDAHKRDT